MITSHLLLRITFFIGLVTLLHAFSFFGGDSKPKAIAIDHDGASLNSKQDVHRGVSEYQAKMYDVHASSFHCDNGKSFDISIINDGFCDCQDGTDEPGTSACHGHFHCVNPGYRVTKIPSSRVDDGVCDCCDGSDEGNVVKCLNTCEAFAAKERVFLDQIAGAYTQGKNVRDQYMVKAKAMITEAQTVSSSSGAQIQQLSMDLQKHEQTLQNAEVAQDEWKKSEKIKVHRDLFDVLGLSVGAKDGRPVSIPKIAMLLSTLLDIVQIQDKHMPAYMKHVMAAMSLPYSVPSFLDSDGGVDDGEDVSEEDPLEDEHHEYDGPGDELEDMYSDELAEGDADAAAEAVEEETQEIPTAEVVDKDADLKAAQAFSSSLLSSLTADQYRQCELITSQFTDKRLFCLCQQQVDENIRLGDIFTSDLQEESAATTDASSQDTVRYHIVTAAKLMILDIVHARKRYLQSQLLWGYMSIVQKAAGNDADALNFASDAFRTEAVAFVEAAQTELESNKDVKEEVFCPQKFLQQPESFQLEFCGVFRVTLIALFNLPGYEGGVESEEVKLLKIAVEDVKNRRNQAQRDASDNESSLQLFNKVIGSVEQEGAEDSTTAYLALRNQCFDTNDGKFSFHVCIFDTITQKEVTGHNTVTIGKYDHMDFDGKTGGVVLHYTGGQNCWGHGPRAGELHVTCGQENRVIDASEPSTCVYVLKMQSPAACTTYYAQTQGIRG